MPKTIETRREAVKSSSEIIYFKNADKPGVHYGSLLNRNYKFHLNHIHVRPLQLKENEARKIFYVIDMLKVQERVSSKFVKHIKDGLYEIRAESEGNIFRMFFIFDEGNIVILFNGFQKKSMKTPKKEIETALKLKEEYYASKK